jgi:hypothetical protein
MIVMFLTNFTPAFNAPYNFDGAISDTVDLIVHVDGATTMIGNDGETFSNSVIVG